MNLRAIKEININISKSQFESFKCGQIFVCFFFFVIVTRTCFSSISGSMRSSVSRLSAPNGRSTPVSRYDCRIDKKSLTISVCVRVASDNKSINHFKFSEISSVYSNNNNIIVSKYSIYCSCNRIGDSQIWFIINVWLLNEMLLCFTYYIY